ncbi:MAG TPA: S8 family peptidase [Steroidobacteraceae bacterium]|nr:S8 family peptidase [Steroidobacteraceae bacterium]
MNRPTSRGGARRHALARSMAVGLLCLAPLAALAAGGFTDRIIVKYRTQPGTPAAAAAQARGAEVSASRFGVAMSRLRSTALGSQVLKIDRRLPIDEAERLAADIAASDPNVEYAEPDRMMHRLLTPNDVRYNEQWHYFESTAGINAPAAWDKATGTGVVVGIVDTGIRPHADLSGQILPGYDFISDTFVSNDGNGRDSDPSDPGDWINAGECGGGQPTQFESSSWHGTHVAGTIAARTNNSTGVAGVAFNAKVVPARVLGKCGGYTSDIADAIVWVSGGNVSGVPANANPAKVINISLGGDGACGNTTQNAINSARSRGASVIVAAGNENRNASLDSPANCSGVVTVASVNRSGGRSYFSNFGSTVEIAAPGGDMRQSAANGILSTLNAGTTTPGADAYAFYQGTSMATPHVVGVVALMLSAKPTLTPDQVTSILQSTARPFPASCSQCGAGIVNASAAVSAALGDDTPPTDPPGTVSETEPNNTLSASQLIQAANTTINGTMGSRSDTDIYRMTLAAGRTLTATLTPNASSDYDLYIYNSNGQLIARSERGTGQVDAASVTNTGSSAFTRYVRVVFWSGGTGSTNGRYTLNLDW